MIMYKKLMCAGIFFSIGVLPLYAQESRVGLWYSGCKDKAKQVSLQIKDTLQEKKLRLKNSLIPVYSHIATVINDGVKKINTQAILQAQRSQHYCALWNSHLKNKVSMARQQLLIYMTPNPHTVPWHKTLRDNIVRTSAQVKDTVQAKTIIAYNNAVPVCQNFGMSVYNGAHIVGVMAANSASKVGVCGRKGLEYVKEEIKTLHVAKNISRCAYKIAKKSRAVQKSVKDSPYTQTILDGMHEYGPSICIAGVGLFCLQDLLALLSK